MDGHFINFLILSNSITQPQGVDFYSLGGNCYIGDIFCYRLFWKFLCYGWSLYGFCDLLGLHSSTAVHRFLESW